ncbi:MAG: hypothetical protein D6B27_01480 [Gammaproteobacteria bacterium]|nr:MAG: hypothetical protein D6B27_01480 [Gammaproteobacteria bacterium]
MLLLTDNKERIKPVWIKKILDSQLSDSGWDDFDGLINFENIYWLGFTKKISWHKKVTSKLSCHRTRTT